MDEQETKTAEERIILGGVEMWAKGLDDTGVPQIAGVTGDGSIRVWPGLRDANKILWVRLYETISPQDGVSIQSTQTTVYTSSGARSRLHLDVVKNVTTAATITIVRNLDGSSTDLNLVTPATPVPTGVGFRIGSFDLNPSGYVKATAGNDDDVTIYVTVDAYDPVGP